MAAQTRSFKVVLIGDAGVGKTQFINSQRNGKFDERYIPTMGVEVHPLTFHTNRGEITLKLWDCAGSQHFGGLREGYYTNADAAIVMYDLSIPTSHQSVNKWKEKFNGVCGAGKPIITCGNKWDTDLTQTTPDGVIAHSNFTRFSFKEPILTLLRELVDPDLQFLDLTCI